LSLFWLICLIGNALLWIARRITTVSKKRFRHLEEFFVLAVFRLIAKNFIEGEM